MATWKRVRDVAYADIFENTLYDAYDARVFIFYNIV